MPDHFDMNMPVGQAKADVMALLEEGVVCPCCEQLAKRYPRTIYSTMAASIIAIYRAAGREWIHIPTLLDRRAAADVPKLRHWGLLEEEMTLREDGGRAGFWRLTEAGVAYVIGNRHVPKTAYVYNNEVLGYEGPQVSIQDALGTKFDYRELMHG